MIRIGVLSMHRMPLGAAIGIFILQLFCVIVAPEYFNEGIWFTIVLNAIFIVIGIIRMFNDINKY